MKNPLVRAQKTIVRADVTKAIGQICDAWPDAVAAEQARGFPSGQGGGSGGIGSHGDPTPNASLRVDKASSWLLRTRRTLALLVRMSPGDSIWSGSFDPPRMKSALIDAAVELVELWPHNVMKLFQSLYDLANVARAEWPVKLRNGESVVDKETGREIIVGGTRRAKTGDDCAECGRYVAGDMSDPICRIDGKPYHRTPCYNTVYKRNRRAKDRDLTEIRSA